MEKKASEKQLLKKLGISMFEREIIGQQTMQKFQQCLVLCFWLASKKVIADLSKFFTKNGTGPTILRENFSENRFRFLLRSIRFDDINTRAERNATDKLASIRDLLNTSLSTGKRHSLWENTLLLTKCYLPSENAAASSSTCPKNLQSTVWRYMHCVMPVFFILMIWKYIVGTMSGS